MQKPTKKEFDLVIEAIRYEYKNKPIISRPPNILEMEESSASKSKREGIFILLEIAQHAELKSITQNNIISVIDGLRLTDKILDDCSHRTHFPSSKPFTIPVSIHTDPTRFYLKIYDSFDNWYAAYQLKKNRKLEDFDLKHIENIYKLVKEINEKLQLNPSPEVIIPLHIRISLGGGAIRNIVKKGNEEYGEDILNYLEDERVILFYEKESYKDYPEALIIKLDINGFGRFKSEIERIYNNKFGKKMQKEQKFLIPAGTKWQDITIKFNDGHNVNIQFKEKVFRSDYKEMGFEDKRTRNPDKQWELLIKLSESNSIIDWQSQPQSKCFNKRLTEQEFGFDEDEDKENQNRGFSYKKAPDSTKKTKQLLAKKLKAFFGVKEDPFFSYRKEGSYKIKIALIPV